VTPRVFRIALANISYPASPTDAVERAVAAVHEAGTAGAAVVAFPECYLPGYRAPGKVIPPPNAQYLERAWDTIAAAAAQANVAVILGTERVTERGVLLTALVLNADGTRAGFQDKVQLDPSEESLYVAGTERALFLINGVTVGIAICHELFRYPETVRWAAQRGAQIVFHPQFHEAEADSYRPTVYGEPGNSFHEQSVLCRAAENTIYVATINAAGVGSPTTSAVASPDGRLLAWQPYGKAGLLVVDCDLTSATGFLASRLRTPVTLS
jgi:predicted amidohydrolase